MLFNRLEVERKRGTHVRGVPGATWLLLVVFLECVSICKLDIRQMRMLLWHCNKIDRSYWSHMIEFTDSGWVPLRNSVNKNGRGCCTNGFLQVSLWRWALSVGFTDAR